MKSILLERFPEIAMQLAFSQPRPHYSSLAWKAPSNLEHIETLYFCGEGMSTCYKALKKWLSENKKRTLVFFVEDLGPLAALLEEDVATELLSCPQIHLTRLWRHPSAHLEVSALRMTPKLRNLRQKLLRKNTVFYASLRETAGAPALFKNLCPNIKHLPKCFSANALEGKFHNIPAIICGAGPSLTSSIKTQADKALIIAGGSAIAALEHLGISPHIAVAIDPHKEELERVKPLNAPLFFAARLLPAVLQSSATSGYVHTETGGSMEAWILEKLGIKTKPIGVDLGSEALSVTTFAVALAVTLGCNPIILNGVDLAYTNNKPYAAGIAPQPLPQETLQRKSQSGKKVQTKLTWIMESACLSAYAKKHPGHTFLNATPEGLGFSPIPYISLEQIPFEKKYDLRKKIQDEIEKNPMPVTAKQIATLYQELQESLQRQLVIAKEMQTSPSYGRSCLLQSDFEEEIAYACFFSHTPGALKFLKIDNIWQYYEAAIQSYLDTFLKNHEAVISSEIRDSREPMGHLNQIY